MVGMFIWMGLKIYLYLYYFPLHNCIFVIIKKNSTALENVNSIIYKWQIIEYHTVLLVINPFHLNMTCFSISGDQFVVLFAVCPRCLVLCKELIYVEILSRIQRILSYVHLPCSSKSQNPLLISSSNLLVWVCIFNFFLTMLNNS